MKKLYILLFGAMQASLVFGQQIAVEPRAKSVEGFVDAVEGISAQVVITNNATNPSDTNITWKIVERTVPTGWRTDFCDPNECMTNKQLNDAGSFKLGIGGRGPLKVDFYNVDNVSGTATVKILLNYNEGSPNFDTATFIARAWATGVIDIVNATQPINVFPNPTSTKLWINTSFAGTKQINIMDISGKVVLQAENDLNDQELNVQSLPQGTYFVQVNNNGTISRSKFIKY